MLGSFFGAWKRTLVIGGKESTPVDGRLSGAAAFRSIEHGRDPCIAEETNPLPLLDSAREPLAGSPSDSLLMLTIRENYVAYSPRTPHSARQILEEILRIQSATRRSQSQDIVSRTVVAAMHYCISAQDALSCRACYPSIMCGRYVSSDESAIEREFNLVHTEWQFPPSFNVAPTQSVPVVRTIEGTRRGALMRWGLIPYFARGVPPKYSTINARVETVQTAASYRGPWKRAQRCLVVAKGFFEWQVQADGKTKVPFFIHVDDQEVFAFAGLWDSSRTDAGDTIESCTHIKIAKGYERIWSQYSKAEFQAMARKLPNPTP